MKYIAFLFTVMLAFSTTGCSTFFNIGENKGYCEEHGCDYSDAGLCADPYEIFKYRRKIKNQPYKNINCSCGSHNSSSSEEVVYKQIDNNKDGEL